MDIDIQTSVHVSDFFSQMCYLEAQAIEKVGDAFQFNPPLTYDTVRALTVAYNIIQGKAGI